MVLVLIPMRQFLEWELETVSEKQSGLSRKSHLVIRSSVCYTKSRWGQFSQNLKGETWMEFDYLARKDGDMRRVNSVGF